MLLRALRGELLKGRRNPVWLVFLVLPLFPAVLGTMNYLGNVSVLTDGWYSLWTQHTLFSASLFLPAQLGRVLRLAVAAGTQREQLERLPLCPGAPPGPCMAASFCWLFLSQRWPRSASGGCMSWVAGWQG